MKVHNVFQVEVQPEQIMKTKTINQQLLQYVFKEVRVEQALKALNLEI